MKKIFVITLAALAIATSAHAQEMSLGPTIGYGHTWTSEEDRDADYYSSYNAGLSFVYSTTTHWGWGVDAKYSAEGVRYAYSAFGDDYEAKTRLNYVRIPIKVYYFFADYGTPIRPKVSAGPSFGFLTDGKYSLRNVDEDFTVSGDIDRDDFRSVDFGLHGSAGVNFKLGEDIWLNTDLTYYHGMTDINANNETTGDDDYKNRNLGINVGITFGIGK